jgi:hypothetical protein
MTEQLTILRQWPEALDAWYRGLLLGKPIGAPDVPETVWQPWLQSVKAHGMAPLLYRWLQTMPASQRPPESMMAQLQEWQILLIASTSYRERELIKVLDILAQIGARPIVLKGTALAYTYYEQPTMRPSGDIDLLVLPAEYLAAREALLNAGYQLWRGGQVEQMEWRSHEQFICPNGNGRQPYMIELHWALSAVTQTLRETKVETMITRAKIVPGPSGEIAIFNRVDALIHACFHLIYTHPNHLRLLWLYDIYLLAQQLNDEDWREALRLSVLWQARIPLKRSLELCAEWFGADFPVEICDLTHFPPQEQEVDLYHLAVYTADNNRLASWWRWHLFQLRYLNWRQRSQYIKLRLWPDRRELDVHYPQLKKWPYPAAYLARLVLIFWKK